MPKTMLIDAAHAEETRVVVVDGNRVEEFDFESQNRKQLRGNIYLAKVTRVEPSLQAAFVEYGGNRHGFLAFNEIHPDYYQIPHADREALLREEAEEHEDDRPEPKARNPEDEDEVDLGGADDEDDVMEEELARRRRRLMRRYKIQEVIRRRQIMLVQVVKEERGNKGAALTTYLSLAGRYGVLMPNTARGGGISRKITTATDRKRLKSVVASLDVPAGMGLIVRTAGAKRTKAEIKRDYDYLLRLWENIRETTLHSIAPALIYEEEDLVKRTIRDLYDKDIDEVWVEGEAGYKEAREFMRMLMPSQAKKVMAYREPTPLFVKHRVEDHLSQIYSPVVPLRSGGYLVINQTEALVAVDVNSGRATRERNIEATALKTNMEAAEEAARQLRLRDLAGLIVIDFIDMDESKNNRAVEKKLKDCLKDDRARVQMGKISPFGLMEISRQRRRTGVLEGTTHVCEHCGGTGRVRSVESSALAALRALEIEALKGGGEATLRVPRAVGLYILNEKRGHLARLHQSFGLFATVVIEDEMAHAEHAIERTAMETRPDHAPPPAPAPVQAYEPPAEDEDDFDDEALEDEEEDAEDEDALEREDSDDDEAHARNPREDRRRDDDEGRRGRRRRRRGRRDDERPERPERAETGEREARAPRAESDEDRDSRRRRRGRRGGRRTRDDGRPQDMFSWVRPWVPYGDDPFVWHDPAEDLKPAADVDSVAAEVAPVPEPAAVPQQTEAAPVAATAEDDIWVELPPADEKPKRSRRTRGRGRGRAEADDAPEAAAEPAPALPPEPESEPEPAAEATPEPVAAEAEPAPAKPKRTRARKAAAPAPEPAPEPAAEPVAEAAPTPEPEPVAAAAPAAPAERDPNEISGPSPAPRRGWWRRG
ncbi:ribonuclease E/G [Phenylobacterium sp.]|uniref:Rne/Rng family ribonuclease n=1 Tax=Phenylobacterium sp. TaxID=1871053 RepID=UPI00301BAFF4